MKMLIKQKEGTCQDVPSFILCFVLFFYSHSIVAGGLEEMS